MTVLHLVQEREPTAAQTASFPAMRCTTMAVSRVLAEPVSLPDFFRQRRHLIDAISTSLYMAGQLVDDPPMRDAYYAVALEDSAALDALEERFKERTSA